MLLFFVIVALLIAIAFLVLGIGIWVKGKFPEIHISHNAEMKKRGITCVRDESHLCKERQTDSCEGCALRKPRKHT
ncbi:MAG: hypothetical protein LBF89_05485 [Bacteroidales bacterium]|nr:hypothetical protein [Bacteroidales bacterium]